MDLAVRAARRAAPDEGDEEGRVMNGRTGAVVERVNFVDVPDDPRYWVAGLSGPGAQQDTDLGRFHNVEDGIKAASDWVFGGAGRWVEVHDSCTQTTMFEESNTLFEPVEPLPIIELPPLPPVVAPGLEPAEEIGAVYLEFRCGEGNNVDRDCLPINGEAADAVTAAREAREWAWRAPRFVRLFSKRTGVNFLTVFGPEEKPPA